MGAPEESDMTRLYRVYCAGDRPCGDVLARGLLDAAQRFARSRGYRPEELSWLGGDVLLGGLRFRIEAIG